MQADVLVIGAGLGGAACALALARGGARVVLAEADPALGEVAPWVDLGVVEHPQRTVHALGPERARELFAFTDLNRRLLAAEGLLDPVGMLWAATEGREPAALGEAARALTELGRQASALGPEATDRRAGGRGFAGGLWMADGGRVPADAARTLSARAVQAGAHLQTGALVRLDEGPGPVIATVGAAQIEAEVVVLAAGAGVGAVDPRLGAAILPVREVALPCTVGAGLAAVGRAGQGWTAWATEPAQTWVSGARWATPHLEVGAPDDRPDPRVVQRLTAFAERYLGLRALGPARGWRFAQARDGLPVIGPMPGQSRRFALVGLGPNPATWALAAGQAVADGLLGGEVRAPDALGAGRLVRWT